MRRSPTDFDDEERVVMRCPVCKVPMIVVEQEEIELDYCTECRGVWFDASELELLFEAYGLSGQFDLAGIAAKPAGHVQEAPRRCPICGKRMEKVVLGSEPGVLVDRCRHGHGLWFDGGELGRVIQEVLAMPGAEGRIVTFLGQVFRAPEASQDPAAES